MASPISYRVRAQALSSTASEQQTSSAVSLQDGQELDEAFTGLDNGTGLMTVAGFGSLLSGKGHGRQEPSALQLVYFGSVQGSSSGRLAIMPLLIPYNRACSSGMLPQSLSDTGIILGHVPSPVLVLSELVGHEGLLDDPFVMTMMQLPC